MNELIKFQKQRIEALERLNAMRLDLISEQAKIIDEMTYKAKNAQARYNMLVRNIDVIEVIDAVYEIPIKN